MGRVHSGVTVPVLSLMNESFKTSPLHHIATSSSHTLRRAGAALGYSSLVFDPHSLPTESLLRPTRISIPATSSAAVG